MPCQHCGSEITQTHQQTSEDSDHFIEYYKCADPRCAAAGVVSGDETDDPGEWYRSGVAADE